MTDDGKEERTYFLSKTVSLFLKREILWLAGVGGMGFG